MLSDVTHIKLLLVGGSSLEVTETVDEVEQEISRARSASFPTGEGSSWAQLSAHPEGGTGSARVDPTAIQGFIEVE